ncbi:MAG: rod shape-determining protein MreC [Gallionella sp.]|nr:rod shape-determining protein MreC [Gallionella sp.]MDD4957951.1 rod shape-determining protein MreC [Gallionella sp.]
MDTSQTFRFAHRGPSPLVRLVFFASLSLLLLFVDVRYRYLESTRISMSVLMLPIQEVATLPESLWQQARERLYTQNSLVRANLRLEVQHQQDAAQLVKLNALTQENLQLRTLVALPPPPSYTQQMAEVIYAERDVFKRKVLVNKGGMALVQAGQVVMDDRGIVGQITRTYPWMSEVTLITDKDHAVPVQLLRTGMRTVLLGAGDTSQLTVRYLPVSTDIQSGDVFVTSGLDGVYPAGIPVGKVVKVERDPAYPFARVRCLPMARVDHYRYLLILSSLAKPLELPIEPESAVKSTPVKLKK